MKLFKIRNRVFNGDHVVSIDSDGDAVRLATSDGDYLELGAESPEGRALWWFVIDGWRGIAWDRTLDLVALFEASHPDEPDDDPDTLRLLTDEFKLPFEVIDLAFERHRVAPAS